jgi:hypothetical protein
MALVVLVMHEYEFRESRHAIGLCTYIGRCVGRILGRILGRTFGRIIGRGSSWYVGNTSCVWQIIEAFATKAVKKNKSSNETIHMNLQRDSQSIPSLLRPIRTKFSLPASRCENNEQTPHGDASCCTMCINASRTEKPCSNNEASESLSF